MDLYQLRNQWNDIDLADGPEASRVRELEEKWRSSKVSPLRDRLFRITVNLVLISFVGLLSIVPFAADSPEMTIACGAFFVVMGLLNFYRALCIKRVDLTAISVKEALEAVYNIERQRLICRSIGIAAAIPLIIFMAMTFSNVYGPLALYGSLIGILIGGCIGLVINHRTTTLLREMKSQLQD